MDDVLYTNDELKTVSSRQELFDIQFYKTNSYLHTIENFVNFVKHCEQMVRKSNEYTNYKAQLFGMGLTKCQFLGHIEADEFGQVEVEMHHGPILTLLDYCAIVTDAFLKRGELLTTFRVARTVLDEHFLNHVQTIMLSKTVHQLVDTGEIFINFNQCNGNLNEFLKKFADGLNEERIQKINRYIDLCEQYDSYDNRLLDIKNTITNWDYEEAKKRSKQNDK